MIEQNPLESKLLNEDEDSRQTFEQLPKLTDFMNKFIAFFIVI